MVSRLLAGEEASESLVRRIRIPHEGSGRCQLSGGVDGSEGHHSLHFRAWVSAAHPRGGETGRWRLGEDDGNEWMTRMSPSI